MKRYDFPVVIERDADGYYAFCPEIRGCHTQGTTYEEALENIKEAILLCLEDMATTGEDLPISRSVSLSTVAVTV